MFLCFQLLELLEASGSNQASMTMVEKAYGSSLSSLIEEKKDYVENVQSFLSRFGIGSSERVMFLNGKLFEHDEQTVKQYMHSWHRKQFFS